MGGFRTLARVTPSNDLANRPLQPLEYHSIWKNGRGSRTWTHNQWFWRPLLYQLSYTPIKKWGDWWGSNPCIPEPQSGVLTTSPQPPYCQHSWQLDQRLPILPERLHSSTFGVWGLNYCVRHGNRWDPSAIITGFSYEDTFAPSKLHRRSFHSLFLTLF